MELRTAASPRDVKHYTTQRLREEFLIPQLFFEDDMKLVYSHIDRIITGGAMPVKKELKLEAGEELRAKYFLERRELGVINIGGAGSIIVDGSQFHTVKPSFLPYSILENMLLVKLFDSRYNNFIIAFFSGKKYLSFALFFRFPQISLPKGCLHSCFNGKKFLPSAGNQYSMQKGEILLKSAVSLPSVIFPESYGQFFRQIH